MERERLLNWLEQVFSTADAEIDCDQLQALLPEFVDWQLAGGNGAAGETRAALVRAHLDHCPDCAEEHAALKSVAELERQGRLPSVAESLARFEESEAYEQEQAPTAPGG